MMTLRVGRNQMNIVEFDPVLHKSDLNRRVDVRDFYRGFFQN